MNVVFLFGLVFSLVFGLRILLCVYVCVFVRHLVLVLVFIRSCCRKKRMKIRVGLPLFVVVKLILIKIDDISQVI